MIPAMSPRVWLSLVLSVPFTMACSTEAGDDEVGDDSETGDGDGDSTGAETGDATDVDTTNTSDTGSDHVVAEFVDSFTVIGSSEHGLNAVRDLEFNPSSPNQLWTYNTAFHGTVIFFDPGTAEQTSEVRIDAYGQHFMAYVSSAAFGDNGNFSSCNESRNEWNDAPQPPDDFMGPALWPSDLDIFTMVGQAFPWVPGELEGSHLDMLHQSPLCMGIAHDVDNVYWVFDGLNGNIVRYDFQADHGPGGGDHSDGIITRYSDATLTRVENVPGHMEIDHATGMLYVADTGGGRIMRLDTATGTNTGSLPGEWDGAEYTGMQGADYQLVVDGLDEPSGLALHEGRLFVSEHGSGDIVAFDLDGTEIDRLATPSANIMGITIGPAGDLWYVDPVANEVVRVGP